MRGSKVIFVKRLTNVLSVCVCVNLSSFSGAIRNFRFFTKSLNPCLAVPPPSSTLPLSLNPPPWPDQFPGDKAFIMGISLPFCSSAYMVISLR